MQCMKCGRDLENGEVFCQSCRDEMQKYPVKPGTVVQLPHRPDRTVLKKQTQRRRTLSAEEQVSLLKRMTRSLALALTLAILLSVGLGYVAVTQYLKNRDRQEVGKNYSAISTTTPAIEPRAKKVG